MEKLNELEIRKIIDKNYGINEILDIKKINRGTADIYLIKTVNMKLIFKYFQDKYSQDQINKEINIIKFLNNKKIPTPKYIKTINNEFSVIYNNRVIIIQKYIEGSTKEKNLGKEKEMLDSAMYLGKIVKALEEYEHTYAFNGSEWFFLNSVEVIKKNKELLVKLNLNDKNAKIIKRDLNIKIEMIEKLKSIDIDDINKVTVKLTHGDYSVMQFIYDDNKIKAIIDFAEVGDMPIIWEIIRSYSFIDENCINGSLNIDNLVKYVRKFQKYMDLNKYDLRFMPYIYLIQLIKSTFGYKQYISSGNEDLLSFGIFRTKLCEYLFEHAEQISNRLLEENCL